MSNLKIKLPPNSKRRQTESDTIKTDLPSLSSKRRRIDAEDGVQVDLLYESHIEENVLYQAEAEIVDVEGEAEPSQSSNELYVAEQSISLDLDVSVSSSKRRPKKKKHIVYSDNDDVDFAIAEAAKLDDKDEEFIPDSSPKLSRKAEGKSKAKANFKKKSKEQKLDSKRVSFIPKSSDISQESIGSGKISDSKKLKESDGDTVPAVQPLPVTPLDVVEGVSDLADFIPKKKKLPTIKKIKSSTAVLNSTPTSTVTTDSTVNLTPNIATSAASTRTLAAMVGNTDIDLSNADIYNSLFKSSGGTPQSGLSRREKEEERRKDLIKMRDAARAARMTELKVGAFDFVTAQEKVLNFEAKLKERNSPALFPHYLAACLKQKKK